jgi:1-acyl-sn-glycerol-3-phosphate acyltransferase/nucleoside-diphosphate-sugar epimerase
MANVVIIDGNNNIAKDLVDRLNESPLVESCQPVSAQNEALSSVLVDSAIDAVVYSPQLQESLVPNLAEAETVFKACAHAGPHKVIILSNAAIYGASPQNTGRIPESQLPPRGQKNRIKNGWVEFEALVGQILPATVKVTILRPSAVLIPDGNDYFSRLFSKQSVFTLPLYDPSIQLLSPKDLANAVCSVVEKSEGGIFNVAPAGVIPLGAALHMARVKRIPLRFSQTDALEYIRHSWAISGEKIERVLGFVPLRSSAKALNEFLGLESKDTEVEFDTFGLDPSYIEKWGRRLYKFLHDVYWRIETKGVEHVPREGRAILVGMHRGFMPFDGAMLLHLIAREFGRYARTLIHPTLVKMPLPFNFIKLGGINADRTNADYILQDDQLLVWFPEGISGAFRYYRDAYKLGAFGRNEFVRAALRNQSPIIPFVTVGSVEIFPIFAKFQWQWWKRLTLWPCFPIAPPFPILSLPLPSKWHTEFLEPLHVEKQYPPAAADDPQIVRAISKEVKSRMQAAIDEMLKRRKSIWFGSIYDNKIADGTVSAKD